MGCVIRGSALGSEHEEVQVMSHATLAAIIPVVALIALAAWISLVYLWRLTGLSAGRGRGAG
jgi:hypothetical protein